MIKKQVLNNGFIDNNMEIHVKNFRRKYKNEYEVIMGFNGYITKLIEKLLHRENNKQNLFIIASIAEMHKFYQSSVILLERGLPECANSLIRTMIDLLIKIIEVIRNEESVDTLILNSDFETLNIIEYLHKNETFNLISEKSLMEMIAYKKNQIQDKTNPRIKIKDLAEKNKVIDMYTMFRLQSDYTHLSTDVLGKVIKITEQGYYIDESLLLEDFKMDIALSISIISKMIEFIVNEYENEKELKDSYKKEYNKFELVFKDLINEKKCNKC